MKPRRYPLSCSPNASLVRPRTATRALALVLALLIPLTPGVAQVTMPTPSSALPVLGDAGEMSVSMERRVGDNIAREIYRDPEFVDDPVLYAYVEGIWKPLLQAARERGDLTDELSERLAWEPLLVRDRSINAFALPGGYMGVHLGLIALTANRDELASVLGHEMSHITQRHIARLTAAQKQQAPWMLAGMVLAALAARSSPQAAQAAAIGSQAVAAQTQLNFSRDMEREADRMGFGVMTRAGFDGRGFVSFFNKLANANRINDNGSFPYLRSHPLTTERIADAQLQVQSQQFSAGAVTREAEPTLEHAMMAARARVLTEPGVDELRSALAQPRAPSFAALSPARKAGVLYAATLAGARLRNFDDARTTLSALTALTAAEPSAAQPVRWLAAEVALARGDAAQAQLLLDPQSDVRPEMLLAAQAQTRNGQAEAAAARLQTWVSVHPTDAAAWLQLSTARGASNDVLGAVRAEAEARAVHFDYAGALDRLKAAQLMARQKADRTSTRTLGGND